MSFGIFENIADALDAAAIAQKKLVRDYKLSDRDAMIDSIRKLAVENLETLARMEYEETGYGRYEHKLEKDMGAVHCPGTEALPFRTFATSEGITIDYPAPFGVVGAVTPVTNPVATIIGNSIGIIASGNAVVFNSHPSARFCSAFAVELINKAVVAAGGPENIATMAAKPDMQTLAAIMNYPAVKLLVGTGGPGMVATLMKSGKKVIAAGAGNPPCIIDETADIRRAAETLYHGTATFENGLLCVAEKELFVLDEVFDQFMDLLEAQGAYRLTGNEIQRVQDVALVRSENGQYSANKHWVGHDAAKIMAAAGVDVPESCMLGFFEADFEAPFVQTEQMMPILPVVRCKDFRQAVEWAVEAEHGNRHSAAIWTKDVYRATEFGKLIETTIYVQNGSMLSAFGHGGSGTNGPTIATPTGEGICDCGSFTRRRRFCVADGGNFIL